MRFKAYKQLDKVDCGPTCLKMIAKHYGKDVSIDILREKCFVTREGASFLTLRDAAENIHFKTFAAELAVDHFNKTPLPCILYWNTNHFVVLYKISKRKGFFSKKQEQIYHIADPSAGLVTVDSNTFEKCWISKGGTKGFALFLSPTEEFFSSGDHEQESTQKFNKTLFLTKNLLRYKSYFGYVGLAVLVSSLLALTLPFVTQSIVDVGISDRNINFITLMLICQLVIFCGVTVTSVIQARLLLHISSRMNISIVSGFLSKIMRLPIRFFESKMVGDIIQRIEDHSRIDRFLTSTFSDAFLSIINLIVFSAVLAFYKVDILTIFFVGSAISILWTFFFMEQRRSIDYRNFQQLVDNTEKIHEIINGMPEIKLNNFENYKRWEWENSQISLFKIRVKDLSLQQYQELGSNVITQLKNLGITYISAYGVLNGDLTFGAMLSISYMTGQLNVPIERMKAFFVQLQSVRFSLDRMGEVHQKTDEEFESGGINGVDFHRALSREEDPEHEKAYSAADGKQQSILFRNVSFKYEGPKSPYALKDVGFDIPMNKITAIVGSSGSGKTTLLKLILKFYDPVEGSISVGGVDLSSLSAKWWRSQCGSVMQDGYIFSDTIARNITMTDDESIDHDRLLNAVRIANIEEFINSLPLGFKTKVGRTGNGISAGQTQRLLIARAVYKNPSFIFFDEATSALDAKNEKIIVDNLNSFFANKTVVVIAHRLSTVKNADQLIVLDRGEVVEIGNHASLILERGNYYDLIKNQLELGN